MTRRTRILFFLLGVVTLAAAVWIALNLKLREVSHTDEAVDVELIAPGAPPSPS